MSVASDSLDVNAEFLGVEMNKRVKASRKKEPKLLSLFDVAAELGLSIDTVRRYTKSGRLASIRLGGVGGRIRVPREAVIKAQREGIPALGNPRD